MEMDDSTNSCEVCDISYETRLVLDFTPNSSDTETMRRKCIDLWRIIDGDPEMCWWSAVSKKESEEVPALEPVVRSERRKPKAVSMLEFVKKKGLYDLKHRTEMHRSCSIECCENSRTVHTIEEKAKPRRKFQRYGESKDAEDVCRDLKNWDKLHR